MLVLRIQGLGFREFRKVSVGYGQRFRCSHSDNPGEAYDLFLLAWQRTMLTGEVEIGTYDSRSGFGV